MVPLSLAPERLSLILRVFCFKVTGLAFRKDAGYEFDGSQLKVTGLQKRSLFTQKCDRRRWK